MCEYFDWLSTLSDSTDVCGNNNFESLGKLKKNCELFISGSNYDRGIFLCGIGNVLLINHKEGDKKVIILADTESDLIEFRSVSDQGLAYDSTKKKILSSKSPDLQKGWLPALFQVSGFEGLSVCKSVLQAEYLLPKREVFTTIRIDPELENPQEKDFKEMVTKATKISKKLTPAFEKKMAKLAAEEIIQEAYEQSDDTPSKSDLKKFQDQMILERVDFNPEGLCLLFGQEALPDQFIVVQLSEEFEVDEITTWYRSEAE